MAGRKVFTSGEILTAADVNSYLMDQSVMVFADSTARSSAIPSPSEGMVTYREDANRVEVYDGAAFGPIGGILQVVSTTKTDTFSTSSATFVDVTGLSVSITPSSTSSKIYVAANILISQSSATADLLARLVRNSTPIHVGTGGSSDNATGHWRQASVLETENVSVNFVDSPATASSVTYKWQVQSGATAFVNRRGNDANYNFASSITVMEVAV